VIKAQELEQALNNLLALDAQLISGKLALLLAELANSPRTYEDAQQHLLPDSALPALLGALAGKKVALQESVVAFGEGTQLGDVTIGEVVKGNSLKISFNLHPPPASSPASTASYEVESSAHRGIIVDTPGKADGEFSTQITDFMARFSKKVDRLTREQYRVIQYLRGERRARISGCAGSGKTLVAIEKALRLSEAGITTLFLCHSPLLAEHIIQMTRGSAVRVLAFGAWIAELTGYTITTSGSWSNYDEPVDELVGRAFDAAVRSECCYDAIIVDEGQDFRDEWWAIVEAALTPPSLGILYIFHDDQQSLLPYRASYPIVRPVMDLSRNCRNAGNVYSVLRRLVPQSPEPEEELLDDGRAVLLPYTYGTEKDIVERALVTLCPGVNPNEVVILLGGAQSLDTSPLAGTEILLSERTNWQEAVRREFDKILADLNLYYVSIPNEKVVSLPFELAELSNNPFPSEKDMLLVQRLAHYFNPGPRSRVLSMGRMAARGDTFTKWRFTSSGFQLEFTGAHGMTDVGLAIGKILRFQSKQWADGLPRPQTTRIQPYYAPEQPDAAIKMYNTADYKGLEANIVVLVTNGKDPMLRQQLYVAVSRARYMLIGLIDRSAATILPATDHL